MTPGQTLTTKRSLDVHTAPTTNRQRYLRSYSAIKAISRKPPSLQDITSMRSQLLVPLLHLLTFAGLVTSRTYGVTSDPTAAANLTFDYIIVGAGLSGLAVAGRLAENPSTSVLVIEAGDDNRSDPRVLDVNLFTTTLGSEIVWTWAAERNITGGKTLGGSSSINGATWTRAADVQIDAWTELLGPEGARLGWNWDGLFPYMKKAEGYTPPRPEERAKGADSIDSFHGFSGPVAVTFPRGMYGGPPQPAFVTGIQNLTGIKKCRDLNGGQPNCVAYVPNNINWRNNDYRSSSAASYLTPVEAIRKNWVTLINHQVTKIVWGAPKGSLQTARGVQFKLSDNTGTTFEAHARKEVIVSAGAIASPTLLQLSGVGDPAVLNPLGIKTVVHLPTVGKNLQEQTLNAVGGAGNGFDPMGTGPADVIAFPNIYELYGSAADTAVADIRKSIHQWAQDQAANAHSAAALEAQYKIQADWIIKDKVPMLELFHIISATPNAVGASLWNLLPFSRGIVQIVSADPFVRPLIRINGFSVHRDLSTQVAGTKLMRQYLAISTVTLPGGELFPGPLVPQNATDEQWESWVESSWTANSHPLGTCAMMKAELGGVVDGKLRVRGTSNVRVVDASIIPMQISAHMSATLFGIAEKAVDMIKLGL